MLFLNALTDSFGTSFGDGLANLVMKYLVTFLMKDFFLVMKAFLGEGHFKSLHDGLGKVFVEGLDKFHGEGLKKFLGEGLYKYLGLV